MRVFHGYDEVLAARVRMGVGALFAVLAVLLLAMFIWGVWNPRQYVVLLTYFSNPFTGTFVVLGCAALAVWLLFPVRSEAAQGRRNAFRWTVLVLALVSALPFLFVIGSSLFAYDGTVASRSADGTLALAVVDRGTYGREVRVWAGRGISARDLGGFGRVCGTDVNARFTGPDEVLVSTMYGDFHLRVDRAGHPVTFIGSHCYGSTGAARSTEVIDEQHSRAGEPATEGIGHRAGTVPLRA